MHERPKKYANIGGKPVLFLDNKSVNSTSPAIELLTIAETARVLKISETGVRRLQQGRHIPFIKVGGSVRFLQSDLRSYLAERRVEAIE